jgi:3',5'-cyclic-AMP phosphodiesterase
MDIEHPSSPNLAGSSRRGFLKWLDWAGTGIVWTVAGGIPQGSALGLGGSALATEAEEFTFIQISDSHIGFKGAVNPNPAGTLQQALDRIARLPSKPAMMIHTDDVSHLSKPAQFDTADQLLKPRASTRISFPASTT